MASTVLSVEREKAAKLGKRNVKLNDQQWVLQRKKIGLSRKSQKTQTTINTVEKTKSTTISYLKVIKDDIQIMF